MTRWRTYAFALFIAIGQASQQPARDASATPAPTPPGTASVAGIVVDDQKQPVRRARVTILALDRSGAGRTATTDDAGRFTLRYLSAGRYSIQASKRAWLDANYGATRPGRSGTPVTIADGQRLGGLTIAMTRGAVIAGTVRDESGEPVRSASVAIFQFSTRNGLRSLGQAGTTTTDDLGAFRFYGLSPGDFIVQASVRISAGNLPAVNALEIRQTMPGDVERGVQTGRSSASGGAVDYSPVFFPGTTEPALAETLHLAGAEERADVNFTLRLAPTVRVEGTIVSPPGVVVTDYQLRLLPAGDEFVALGNLMPAPRPDKDGHFVVTGVAPGRYTFLAAGGAAPPGPAGPGSPPRQLVGQAFVDISVSGQNLDVPIALQPPLTLRGRIVFDGANPPKDAAGIQIGLQLITERQLLMATPASNAGGPLIFTFPPLPSGKYAVLYNTPRNSPWFLLSAIGGGRDVLDAPIDLRDNLTDLVVTFTDRPSEISGRLEDTTGRPAPDYFIIVFPADRSLWTPTTRRIQTSRPGNDGTFTLKGLPAGDYLIGALTDVEPGEWFAPAFLEQVARLSQKVGVVSGEKSVVGSLRVSGG